MNSLDALDIVYSYCASLFGEECEIVKRDLEVLEILKKHLSIFNTEPQCLIPDLIILQGSEINIDEAKIIKEWLENE